MPALPAACPHAALDPSQRSTVQGFPSPVHAVPEGDFASAGHVGDVPVHDSAASHSPADARHVVVAGWKAS
ncbi:MAG: hypothetical protein ACKPBU_13335, partial [Alphaproteobacteria bacterium]